MKTIRRIGVLTGGGDAPGLNAVIRAVVKSAHNHGIACLGLEDSFDGLIEPNRHRVLMPKDVTGILRVGGTILGTVNRGNPFLYPIETSDGKRDYSQRCIDMFHQLGLDGLVVIGGDGTLAIAHEFAKRGIPLVGVPKTIDNDIVEHHQLLRLRHRGQLRHRRHRSPAHHRRSAPSRDGRRGDGPLRRLDRAATPASPAAPTPSSSPRFPFDIELVAKRIKAREKWGASFSIVVVAEGAVPKDGKRHLIKEAHGGYVERLGGVAAAVAAQLGKLTGKETRSVVLGHLQRGGAPDQLRPRRWRRASAARPCSC